MKRFWVSRFFWVILIFGTAGFFVALSNRGGNVSTRNPETDIVHRQDLLQKVTVAGNIFPNKKTIFTAPYAGYVHKIYVKQGEFVKANTPVVSLVQTLHGREDVYPMRAPYDGTVVQVLKTEGEYVDQGKDNPIVRIDDLTRFFVVVDVPESDIAKVKIGQEAQIKAPAVMDRTYKGVVREIALAAKEKKDWNRSGDRVEFTVKIEVLDKDDQIRSGSSVIVDIVTAKRSGVLTLRQEYVQRGDDDQYFVTLENGKRRNIKVGLQNEDLMEIVDGLKEGESVRMVDFLSLMEGK